MPAPAASIEDAFRTVRRKIYAWDRSFEVSFQYMNLMILFKMSIKEGHSGCYKNSLFSSSEKGEGS